MTAITPVLQGEVLDSELRLSLAQLCRCCQCSTDWLLSLVDEGIIVMQRQQGRCWFDGEALERALIVRRLQQDLGVNLAGAALALELLSELRRLRSL